MSTNINGLQVWTFDAGPGDDWSADEEFYRAEDVRGLLTRMETDLRQRLATELRDLADQPMETENHTTVAVRHVINEGYRRAADHIAPPGA